MVRSMIGCRQMLHRSSSSSEPSISSTSSTLIDGDGGDSNLSLFDGGVDELEVIRVSCKTIYCNELKLDQGCQILSIRAYHETHLKQTTH